MKTSDKNIKQIIKFSAIGVLNTIIDFGIFYLIVAYTPVDKAVAQVVSVTVAMTNSYLLNRYFTFGKTGAVRFDEMIRFVMINLASMAASILFLLVFYDWLHVENIANSLLEGIGIPYILDDAKAKLLAKILATPFVLAVNFIGNKFWVFNSKEGK